MTGTKSSNRPRKNSPPPPSRVVMGDYGETILRIMYRLRGGTRREIAEFLALELEAAQNAGDFSVAEEGRDYLKENELGSLSIEHRVYLTLASLERQHFVKGFSLPRTRRNGVRVGRPGLWYELPSKGSTYAGGDLLGMGGSASSLSGAYGRHGSRARDAIARKEGSDRKIAHTRSRNRMFVILTDDAADSKGAVEVDFRELWGESHQGFPIFGGRLLDSAGNPVRGPRIYEQCEPDGLVPITFRDGPSCSYLVEIESSTRSEAVAKKIDRYAAAAISEYESLAVGRSSSQVAEYEEELETLTKEQEEADDAMEWAKRDMEGLSRSSERRAIAEAEFDSIWEASVKRNERISELRNHLKKVSKDKDAAVKTYLGFPEAVKPVLFVLPKAQAAWSLAHRLREGAYEMPRLEKLQKLWKGEVDFRRLILFSGVDMIEDGYAFVEEPHTAWQDLAGRDVSLRQVAEETCLLRKRPEVKEV